MPKVASKRKKPTRTPETWDVQMWPLDRLTPYARNAKLHSEAAIQKLATVIRKVGVLVPIVVDADGVILKGHRTRLACLALGLPTVPVRVAKHLSEVDAKAWRLADNRLGQDTAWDDELLRLDLGELEAGGFNMALTGFGDEELRALLHPESGLQAGADPDAVPELPKQPLTVPGDLILLGGHRLICGDSTHAHVVDALLGSEKPALMVTDPPYGVEYDPNWRNEVDRQNGKPYGDRAVGKVSNDDDADWTEAWALFPGSVVYCWHAGWHASIVQRSLEDAGFEMRSQIIWGKTRLIISRGHYHWQHEPCWYAVRKGATAEWAGDRSQTTLWTIEHPKSDTGHGTQKPVEAMRRPIHNHAGDVYDPFLGSGTTLIAAEMEGRRCFGVELSPAYCDVIVTRWEQATGQTAQRPQAAA